MGKRSRADDTEAEDGVEEAVEATPEPAEERDPEEAHEGGVDPDDDGRRARVMRFAKRMMDRRELSNDTREILGSVLATSDKAKNEAVRMVAREVRSYLDALELKDDVKELITSYSLEISLSLKPLAAAAKAAEAAAGEAAEEAEADD